MVSTRSDESHPHQPLGPTVAPAPPAMATVQADLRVERHPVATPPRRFGVNIEIQDYAEELNLWDWLKDSGAQVLREFHPEKNLRREDAPADRWNGCKDKATFARFRDEVMTNPAASIDWGTYRFRERVPWLGVPDTIIGKVSAMGTASVCSLGWCPKHYAHPLIPDVEDPHDFTPERLDWRAAASAYEYYFAEIYWFAKQHGVGRYSMHNELEFYHPFLRMPDREPYLKRGSEAIKGRDPEAWPVVTHAIAVQFAGMAYLARMAMDDVARVLTNEGVALPTMQLAGPTSAHIWEPLWKMAEPWLDVCNFHFYAIDPRFVRMLYPAVENTVRATGKQVAISEFNRRGGPMEAEDTYFAMGSSIELAMIFLELFRQPRPEGPACDWVTFYHFAFPGTHRNYKSLVFGDMNLMDWTQGTDQKLCFRGEDWYPRVEEMQIRFATPAYAMFRMFARCAPAACGSDAATVHELSSLILYGSDSGPFAEIEGMAVEHDDRLVVTLVSARKERSGRLRLDFSAFADRYQTAFVRVTDQTRRDALIATDVLGDRTHLVLECPPTSVLQVILVAFDVSQATAPRLVEETYTPGTLADGLALHQTTRLRFLAELAGDTVDLSELAVTWESTEPELVPISSSGLVIRLRESDRPVTLRAQLGDATVAADLRVNPPHAS